MRGNEVYVLDATYRADSGSIDKVNCSYRTQGVKKIKKNDKEYNRISDHIGNFPLVMISPYDSEIINESGEERRKYINMLLGQIDRSYLHDLMRYNQLIQHRNSILKNMSSISQNEILEVVDMQLSVLGDSIYSKRLEVIDKLSPIVERYYSALSGGKEEISIEYSSKLENGSMQQILSENIQKDFACQYTSAGVQR